VVQLFISQQRIDAWDRVGSITMEDDVLCLLPDRHQLRLTPAIAVKKVVSGDSDPLDLCGRVKTSTEVAALGGEQYMESLLVGEVAYDVQPGFLAEPLAQDRAALERLRAFLLTLG
jgi:hypothetical protein